MSLYLLQAILIRYTINPPFSQAVFPSSAGFCLVRSREVLPFTQSDLDMAWVPTTA